MKGFIIDVAKCNGCYNCQIACKDEHVENSWMPYTQPQPDTGHFWMKVHEMVRGSVPKVKMSYLATPCMHCKDAPCIPACEPQAIYRREDGLVLIHPEKCNGCKDCMEACPYDVIYFNEALNLAQKCTGCAHLLDSGWKEPRCVDACATGALTFGEIGEFQELFDNAEILHPEYETHPQVVYYNLPRRFIAGTVFDPEADEVVIGARVTLTDESSGETILEHTDSFGDFWFKQIAVGQYSLTFEVDGYQTHQMKHINTEKDVNAGDIALHRKPVTVPA